MLCNFYQRQEVSYSEPKRDRVKPLPVFYAGKPNHLFSLKVGKFWLWRAFNEKVMRGIFKARRVGISKRAEEKHFTFK